MSNYIVEVETLLPDEMKEWLATVPRCGWRYSDQPKHKTHNGKGNSYGRACAAPIETEGSYYCDRHLALYSQKNYIEEDPLGYPEDTKAKAPSPKAPSPVSVPKGVLVCAWHYSSSLEKMDATGRICGAVVDINSKYGMYCVHHAEMLTKGEPFEADPLM